MTDEEKKVQKKKTDDLIGTRKSQYSFDEEKALMFLHKSDDMLKMIDQQPINSFDNDDT